MCRRARRHELEHCQAVSPVPRKALHFFARAPPSAAAPRSDMSPTLEADGSIACAIFSHLEHPRDRIALAAVSRVFRDAEKSDASLPELGSEVYRTAVTEPEPAYYWSYRADRAAFTRLRLPLTRAWNEALYWYRRAPERVDAFATSWINSTRELVMALEMALERAHDDDDVDGDFPGERDPDSVALTAKLVKVWQDSEPDKPMTDSLGLLDEVLYQLYEYPGTGRADEGDIMFGIGSAYGPRSAHMEEWYWRAYNECNAEAAEYFAEYFESYGDYEKARQELRYAASWGSSEAAWGLAVTYEHGEGNLKRNRPKALKYYRVSLKLERRRRRRRAPRRPPGEVHKRARQKVDALAADLEARPYPQKDEILTEEGDHDPDCDDDEWEWSEDDSEAAEEDAAAEAAAAAEDAAKVEVKVEEDVDLAELAAKVKSKIR